MRNDGKLCVQLLWLGVMATAMQAQGHVHVYPAPDGEPLSHRFAVRVEGRDSPVYVAHVQVIAVATEGNKNEVRTEGEASFTSFDTDGKVRVTVTTSQDVQQAKILPSSYGIAPSISGKNVSFTITMSQQVTLEVNGDWNNSLHVFANPVEKDTPKPHDANVIYFGPGVHFISPQKIGSGKTVYVAGGAVLYGKFAGPEEHRSIFSLVGNGVTLRGRGIIDGSLNPKGPGSGNMIFGRGENLKIEGVTLRDSNDWNVPIWASKHVTVDNIKVFGWRGNSDGVDVVNSEDVKITNSFLRTFDDLVVVKTKDPAAGPSQDITATHLVLWNEIAHPLSIGAELRKPVENVTFSDCDVIHDMGRDWIFRIYHTDSAPIRHILFENIRIEEDRRLASLWINKARWGRDDERGHIDDVTFRNIQTVVPTRDHAIQFLGFDADHAIHGVHFENVTEGGKPLKSSEIEANDFVTDVTVVP